MNPCGLHTAIVEARLRRPATEPDPFKDLVAGISRQSLNVLQNSFVSPRLGQMEIWNEENTAKFYEAFPHLTKINGEE